jgi:hypothetical protein
MSWFGLPSAGSESEMARSTFSDPYSLPGKFTDFLEWRPGMAISGHVLYVVRHSADNTMACLAEFQYRPICPGQNRDSNTHVLYRLFTSHVNWPSNIKREHLLCFENWDWSVCAEDMAADDRISAPSFFTTTTVNLGWVVPGLPEDAVATVSKTRNDESEFAAGSAH